MIKHIKSNFIAGVLVLFPAVVTVFIFKFLIEWISKAFLDPAIKFVRPYLDEAYLVFLAKLAAFFIIVAVIVFIGFAMRYILTRRLISFAEDLLLKVPILNKIYGSIREVSRVLFGNSKQFFSRVVMIEYPRKGLYSIAFVMAEQAAEMEEKTGKQMLSVFVPTAPNPTSGIVLMVPKDEALPSSMSVEEGLKVIISGGAVVPKK